MHALTCVCMYIYSDQATDPDTTCVQTDHFKYWIKLQSDCAIQSELVKS